jgi:hypothetical protein
MSDRRPRIAFSSPQNEAMLDRLVYQDFQRRLGSDLNERQKQRLVKTVRHYMEQVSAALPNESIQIQNKEVLSAVVPDFMSYINRSQSVPQEKEQQDPSRMDVGSRFSQLQNERAGAKNTPPPPPDFRIPLDEEGPAPITIYEQVKKAREEETSRGEALIARSMRAEQSFNDAKVQSSQFEMVVMSEREKARTISQRESATEMASRFVSPDPRRIFMKDVLDGNPTGASDGQGTSLESLLGNSSGTGNPTLALPDTLRNRPVLPQDNLIRQDDIIAYKENEYNLFVYSADRNWVTNQTQNRYNFTVNFDPANNVPGFTFAPTAAIKFKNIVRIELVKTIMPIEGVDIIQQRLVASGSTTYNTTLNVNILSFPYLNIRIPELDNNNYGTDYNLQQAFGVVQYDANWVSDNNATSKGGFLAMIPKFLKCQKVYLPTPLATLQKMTISIQRPDGTLVSETLDTLDISGVKASSNLAANGVVTGTSYSDTSGGYIWIQTNTWFSRFMVNQGDRIQIANIALPASYSGNAAAATDLITYLQRSEGHLVVGIAHSTKSGASIYFNDGPNLVGYGNYIIIRSRMRDPTTGSVSVDTYGLLGSSANTTFLNGLFTTAFTTGRFINLSHQTTLVFRVITRDLDPTSRIRPDNM